MPTWYDGHVLRDVNRMTEGNVMTWKLEQFDYWGAARWRAIDTSGKRRPFTGASPEGFATDEEATEALQAALAYTAWVESKADAHTVDVLRDVAGTLRYMATGMWATTMSDVETATVDDSETACPERSSRQLVSAILREVADEVDAVAKLLGMANASIAEVLREDDGGAA